MIHFFERHVLVLDEPSGRLQLGVAAHELEVTELGVRHQRAVDEDGTADAGAEGQHDHHAGHAAAGSVSHLGDACGVCVVEHHHGPAAALARAASLTSVPIHVSSMLAADSSHSVDDHGRDGHAERTFPLVAGDEFSMTSNTASGVEGCGVLIRVRFLQQLPFGDVDGGSLHPRPANVDSVLDVHDPPASSIA